MEFSVGTGSVRLPLLQKVNRMDRYGGYACRRRQHDRYASIKKKAEYGKSEVRELSKR
jgi:hypothetical protein